MTAEYMRRWRADHPKSPEQLATEAAERRERRAATPGHDARLARQRRALNPEKHRDADRRRAALPIRKASKRAWDQLDPPSYVGREPREIVSRLTFAARALRGDRFEDWD